MYFMYFSLPAPLNSPLSSPAAPEGGADGGAVPAGGDASWARNDRGLRRTRARQPLQVRPHLPARRPDHRGAAVRQQDALARLRGVPQPHGTAGQVERPRRVSEGESLCCVFG